MKNYIDTLTKTKKQIEQDFMADENRMSDQRAAFQKQIKEVNESLAELDQAKKKAVRDNDQETYIAAVEQEKKKHEELEYATFCLEAISSAFTDEELIQKFNEVAKSFDSQMKEIKKEYETQKAALADKYIEMIKLQDEFLTIRRMFSDRMQQSDENADAVFEFGAYRSFGKKFMKTVSFPLDMTEQDNFFEEELLKKGLHPHAGDLVLSKRNCVKDLPKTKF